MQVEEEYLFVRMDECIDSLGDAKALKFWTHKTPIGKFVLHLKIYIRHRFYATSRRINTYECRTF